ncbi:MAG: type III-A CRISPR-associated protein Csm2 [Deltaproteobacteria bacterium]|nr:type III-A CRISPR-associated protein Csm2 [Deltaproteobacteria bacterium]
MLANNHSLYDSSALTRKHVEEWVKNGPNNDLIEEVDNFGEYIAKTLAAAKIIIGIGHREKKVDESVTTSQIRQIFGKLKSIEAKGYGNDGTRTEFIMLKPLLAYTAGRHNKTGMERLKERVTWGIDAVLNGEGQEEVLRFKNFCKLFEAILAYHKAHGGK